MQGGGATGVEYGGGGSDGHKLAGDGRGDFTTADSELFAELADYLAVRQ